ncbi:hypothetical protein [Actinoallomurus sp. NPDC052274]|uniref:hypothetical protein n=1 Tax=Actinoallomurus sp. NPDC052274 TaxID=3155420 RepID=UPI00342F39F2
MVPGNFRLTADDPEWPIVFDPDAKVSKITFGLDNSFADAAHGITAAPQQHLRVAIMDVDGSVQKIYDPVIIGRQTPTTPGGTKPVTITVPKPATAWAAFISPGKDGPADRRIGFCLT